jgi:hypothetical protein
MRSGTVARDCFCAFIVFGALLALWCTPVSAASDALVNLDEDLPTALEDAIPTKPHEINGQGALRYEGAVKARTERVTLSPELQAGLAPGWQVNLSAPFVLGATREEAGSRNLRLRALYQVLSESGAWPALAVSTRAELPTGLQSNGVDTRVKVLATKTIGPPSTLDRVHLNAAWLHNAGRQPGEREHYYSLVAGYTRVMGSKSLLVVDYVREQEQERGLTADLLEVGVRRLLGQHLVVGGGVGVGLDGNSPPLWCSIALQYGL